MGGVPCIRGLRIPVATIVGMVADAITEDEILALYRDLEAETIRVPEARRKDLANVKSLWLPRREGPGRQRFWLPDP